MKISSEKGFTLIEVIVVAAIIAILAGILVPLILKEIDESKITRAAGDLRSIFTAMIVLRKDTGQWPQLTGGECDPAVTLLKGNGDLPGDLLDTGYDTETTGSFDDHLLRDANGCYNNWKGSYLTVVNADPWGNSYLLNADGFGAADKSVWIISAGPNGIMETQTTSDMPAGDDVGFIIQGRTGAAEE
jgi:general secretion pathway protein G